MKLELIFIVVIYFLNSIDAASILGIFPMGSHSHFIIGHTLMKELASRGHQVTVISPYPQKTPIKNYEDVDLSEVLKMNEAMTAMMFDPPFLKSPTILMPVVFHMWMINSTSQIFELKTMQDFLKLDKKFDLVIIEDFLMHSLLGFCHKYNAPCITISATGLTFLVSNQVGNPISPSYVPTMLTTYTSIMSFFERLHNSIMYIMLELTTHMYALPKHNEILQKYFPGAPHISDIYYNMSLTFINSNLGTQAPVPLVPNLVDIGGLHITPNKPLPNDIQKFLDDAKEGVIYLSLGSVLRSSLLPSEKRNIFLEVFGKLKQKVLWKYEKEDLSGKPPNVKISKWLPQSDVLAHPNVKLFVSHGGLLSTVETTYHGVPIVGLPCFGDQETNMINAEEAGYARSIPLRDLNVEKLYSLIQEVINNPKYTENAQLKSKIMRDQPMKPLDKGVFWVEYVLRHKGAPHLRTAALSLAWYQYLLLDVTLFVLFVLFGSYVILRYLITRFICYSKKSSKISKSKKIN